jgi:hypothetical protein
LKEKIKEDKEVRKIDHGQFNKLNNTLMGALDHYTEKKEEHVSKVLKMWVMWT